MSTRANIVITDETGDQLFFYRHSDGYPEGTLPTLKKFMTMVATGKIRDNVSQAAGHLIIIGHKEYASSRKGPYAQKWKAGAYEPTTGYHGDIEYLYHLNLSNLTLEVLNPNSTPIAAYPTITFKPKKK